MQFISLWKLFLWMSSAALVLSLGIAPAVRAFSGSARWVVRQPRLPWLATGQVSGALLMLAFFSSRLYSPPPITKSLSTPKP